MLGMIMEMYSSIINSLVVNAVPDLVVTMVPVVLLSVLPVLVLTNSVSSILLLVKNSILSKARVRFTDKVNTYRYIDVYSGA